MRVLLVNAFHYLRGGVERTYLDESRWLAGAGHEIAHLAIRDPRNLPSPTADFFAPPADFGEGAPVGRQLAALPRALWSAPAARAASAIAGSFRPDVAHVHAPSRYLTPSVLRALDRAGVPIVMTLHDFKPWCTNRILFAHDAPCERCRGGRHWRALATACVQDSRAKSALGSLEAYLHQALDAYRPVRLWIAPSAFVEAKARSFGVDPARLRVLPHGVEPASAPVPGAPAGTPDEPFVLYAGRLSVEKGVRVLPALARGVAPRPVLVVGEGPLAGWLDREAQAIPNLRRLGFRPDPELAALRARAAVVVVPSLFYEHFCYAAAEALLAGRPVVASRIGAIPELVEDGVTGLLAEPGDVPGWIAAVTRALEDPGSAGWAEEGRARVCRSCVPSGHLESLLAIYREAVAARA